MDTLENHRATFLCPLPRAIVYVWKLNDTTSSNTSIDTDDFEQKEDYFSVIAKAEYNNTKVQCFGHTNLSDLWAAFKQIKP